MNKTVLKASILCALGLASGQTLAHVGYGTALYDAPGVINPITGVAGTGAYAPNTTAGFNPTVSSNSGYLNGLEPTTYGDSHNNRFRFFTLDTASVVSFTITGVANSVVTGNANAALNGLTPDTLNPAFSLFRGTVPASSHDGVGDENGLTPAQITTLNSPAVLSYLANHPGYATWSPFADANDEIGANGGGASMGGANGKWGVYRTNADFAIGNNNGLVSTIEYTGISGADAAIGATFTDVQGNTQSVLNPDGTVDNSVSFSGLLDAGVYSLVIGGANSANYDTVRTNVLLGVATITGDPTLGTSYDSANGTTFNNDYAAARLARNVSITGFNVAAVPLPAAVWLFGSILPILGFFRRKQK